MLLPQAFTTFTPSLHPDLCENRIGTSAHPTHCIWSSGAWPKAKKSCSGRQTLYLHSRGWCIGLDLPYFRSQTGNSLRKWRWSNFVSGTSTTKLTSQQQWCWLLMQHPGIHTPPKASQRQTAQLHRRLWERWYKGGRGWGWWGISLFNSTIREMRYGYLGIYKHSCVVQMLVPHRAVTAKMRH